jgi:hypothetical protein
MAGAQPRTSCRSLFKQLEIPAVPCQYILSLMNFVIYNQIKIFKQIYPYSVLIEGILTVIIGQMPTYHFFKRVHSFFQLNQPTRCSDFSSLLLVIWWSGRPARPRPTALLSPSSDDKPKAATAVVVAPDDGHEDARNMLSCI